MSVSRARAPKSAPAVPNKKRKSKTPDALPETTLDSKKKAMAAEELKLREQMERYTKLIENAPKLAKERERRQREQFVSRAARTEHRPNSRTALPDRRHHWDAAKPAPEAVRNPRLRAERNRGRFMFFVLLLTFAAVVAWLYFTMTRASGW